MNSPEILEIKSKLASAKAKWRIASDRADGAMELFKAHEVERAWALREVEKLEEELIKVKSGKWSLWQVF